MTFSSSPGLRSLLGRVLAVLALLSVARGTVAAPPGYRLPAPMDVVLSGPEGDSLQRGVARLALPPYTTEWLLADVSFGVNRIFTNYSGDVSGRFLELASLTSPPGKPWPGTLPKVSAAIARYQKPDGHFGVDVDLAKPLTRGSAPIPMLWGNARLLVGLVTAARELRDPALLASARRLGDFYVTSADQLCAPAREAEYRASGTGGDSYTCCYFPAIESLAMLFRATRDARYLRQAERMAEWFRRFDQLPIDHSHGNLCAYRGILDLYGITGRQEYLDRACAKWEEAVARGFVWPLGGVGEHWYVSYPGDEGCSESDWLRFNLDLWRHTGRTKYLDLAERLLRNQYAANQCANGGFGWRNLEGDPAGPFATHGAPDEWNFCCSFHGPLGLHFLKSYLAAGSERAIYLNFPLAFSARVDAGGTRWRVATAETGGPLGLYSTMIRVARAGGAAREPVALRVRVPAWATRAEVMKAGRWQSIRATDGYAEVARDCRGGQDYAVRFSAELQAEGRRFRPVRPEAGQAAKLADVSLLNGPDMLFARVPGPGRATLLATVDASGRLDVLRDASGGPATVALNGPPAGPDDVRRALAEGRPVALRSWREAPRGGRLAFCHDVVVVPASWITSAQRAAFARRSEELAGPVYGTNLEQRRELWPAPGGWTFAPDGLLVAGGDVALLSGERYGDYRFEFDVMLPAAGQGVTGWVVRARDESNCVMFQLQSSDSPYSAPEFKTRPNTLRPHVRRGGAWIIEQPVDLPMQVRRGEVHHVSTECRGDTITVYIDGVRVHTMRERSLLGGTVGFRANGAAEQGLFRSIALTRLSR